MWLQEQVDSSICQWWEVPAYLHSQHQEEIIKATLSPSGIFTLYLKSVRLFLQHHLFLQHLNFSLHRSMRFNHTCSKSLMFYFLFFKGYNFTSVLPAPPTTDFIYLSDSSKFQTYFMPSFSMISLPSLLSNNQRSPWAWASSHTVIPVLRSFFSFLLVWRMLFLYVVPIVLFQYTYNLIF